MKIVSLTLHLELTSDATFGRGDGVAGLVDEEIEFEPETGLPFIHGRTVKGLLREESANLLFSLKNIAPDNEANPLFQALGEVSQRLFGAPGASDRDGGSLRVGHARVADKLRQAVLYWLFAQLDPESLDAPDILFKRRKEIFTSLTDIRRQTAMTHDGVPDSGSLRSRRVVLRETSFATEISFSDNASDDATGFLAACAMGLRRGGSARNRGSGRLVASLFRADEDVTRQSFEKFVTRVLRIAGS